MPTRVEKRAARNVERVPEPIGDAGLFVGLLHRRPRKIQAGGTGTADTQTTPAPAPIALATAEIETEAIKPKFDRAAYQKAYMLKYMREWRKRQNDPAK